MNLFTETNSLKSMNEMIVEQIPKYSLIGDLPLSREDFNYLASTINFLYENDINTKNFNIYKEALVAFIVFCAVYEYDNNTFWRPIEKYIGDLTYPRRIEIFSTFISVVKKYNLQTFENESEEGYTYVTPILCHAGIPINAFDSYFSAISNTVNDAFYDDFDVDDYLSYLNNKTEMPVKRYIKLTSKRDSYSFIQNTKQLILSDSVDSDEEMDSGNYTRMMEQISLWKDRPKNKENLQARRNVQITPPKIKIDLDGVGVYCELPRIIVKDCYDSYLIWEISSDETTNIVKADFFRRSEVFVSEEKIITLKPALSYTITLKVDDKQISKWEFDGVKDYYVAFSQNGNVIKTEHLPNATVILLLHKNISILEKDELSMMELPQIPLWTDYMVYQADLSNVKLLKCSGFHIRVNSESKPVIDGGETLFNQEHSRAYITLPYIKVPIIADGDWHIEIKYKAGSDVISKSNVVVQSNRTKIPLSFYINNGSYGEYDIKVWNRSGNNGRFTIEYVPFGTIQIDENDYWPTNYQGYVKNIQILQTSKNVDIDIYNADKLSEIHHNDYHIHRYKINEKDRFLIGDYRYTINGYVYSTTIKKSVYPVSWGIIGLNEEIIDLSSKVYTLTLQDLSNATDPYLLFGFNFDLIYDIQVVKIDLVGSDRRIVQSNNMLIHKKDGLRVPLNPYLFEVQNTSNVIDFHLRVTLLDSNEMSVSSFLIARFQDEVVVENARYSVNENDISFTWKEQGARFGRELVLFNFLRPWVQPYHFKIEDKICEITIDMEWLEEGIYRYVIQKEADELFEEVEAEVCSLKEFQKRRIIVKGERKYSTDMEKILYQILRSRFMKKELVPRLFAQIKSQISSMSVKIPEDINMLANAYILHDRFYLGNEDATQVLDLFAALFDLFSSYGSDTIKFILESDFPTRYKKELLHKFYCNHLTSTTKINDFHFKLLTEIDEDMAGFINLIQSEHNSRGLNWAGLSGIDALKEEDLFGAGDADTTFLTEENLGKSSYITDYFRYVSNSLLLPRNMLKTSADFLREFQRDQVVQESIIFGKTRLHLLVEWKEKNRGANQIQERLSLVMNTPCKKELKDQFKDAFTAIAKRRTDDELGYYIGLIALYASFIRNGLMQETKQFRRLLQDTIESCEKLYYRDAIIIELYMRLERGYSWV
ncbi:Uncharacterised protein [Bacillus freudenreichii]|nr:Uncharacterised protein [Bacillus freudenreichii]